MIQLKIRKIGNSLGVVLPKEALARLKAGEGDVLFVSETPDGLTLSIIDERVAEQVDVMRDVAQRYRNTLRTLAK
jgi:putative addiction module antidote